MSLEIFVDACSGYRANERPQGFTVDEEVYEIASIEHKWRSPDAMFFKARSTEGSSTCIDQWTLQSGFDGDALLARPSILLISVEPNATSESESRIAGCEHCRPDEAQIPLDWILADVLDKRGPYEFVLTGTARCPNCRAELSEKTLVEPQGWIDVEATTKP
jgi:hypothetical protein